jgi:hypothetical protein
MAGRFWHRAERGLQWASHAHLLLGPTGLGSLIMTVISGIVVAFAAWWGKAPLYQTILAGMGAMAAALFIANQSLRLVATSKMPAAITRQQARRLDRDEPGGMRLGGATAIVITLLASALIIVAGLYGITTYTEWKRDLESTYVFAVPSRVIPWGTDQALKFGIDIQPINPGNLAITSNEYDYEYDYFNGEMTESEQDKRFRGLDARIGDPTDNGINIPPHSGKYYYKTFDDKNMTQERWDNFIKRKEYIYLFVVYRYLVSGYLKETQVCIFFAAADGLSVHVCRNKTFWVN